MSNSGVARVDVFTRAKRLLVPYPRDVASEWPYVTKPVAVEVSLRALIESDEFGEVGQFDAGGIREVHAQIVGWREGRAHAIAPG